jgi:hypothetical protein
MTFSISFRVGRWFAGCGGIDGVDIVAEILNISLIIYTSDLTEPIFDTMRKNYDERKCTARADIYRLKSIQHKLGRVIESHSSVWGLKRWSDVS